VARLQALRDKSLLRVVSEDAPHFALLETVRVFALERLREAGEEEATFRGHAEHVVARARAAFQRSRGPAFSEALTELTVLRPEILAVAARGAAGLLGRSTLPLEGLLALGPLDDFFTESGAILARLDRALAGADVPLAMLAQALDFRARAIGRLGRPDEASATI